MQKQSGKIFFHPLSVSNSLKLCACFGTMIFGLSDSNAFAQDVVKTESSEMTATEKSQNKQPPPLVLQNRYFLKTLRPEISIFGGTVLNESYSQTKNLGARFGMFFNEALGAEYTYSKFVSGDSADLSALKKIQYCDEKGTTCKRLEPSFIRLNAAHFGTLTFAPVYGKINLLDLGIVYSDIYANAGFGLVSTSQGNKNAGIFGLGQRFYFKKNYNLRIDATDHIFSEERENLGKKSKSTKHAWSVTLGFSYFVIE